MKILNELENRSLARENEEIIVEEFEDNDFVVLNKLEEMSGSIVTEKPENVLLNCIADYAAKTYGAELTFENDRVCAIITVGNNEKISIKGYGTINLGVNQIVIRNQHGGITIHSDVEKARIYLDTIMAINKKQPKSIDESLENINNILYGK